MLLFIQKNQPLKGHSCIITFWSLISTSLQSWYYCSEWQGTSYLYGESEWKVAAWDFYQKQMLIYIYVQILITSNISWSNYSVLVYPTYEPRD